MDKIVICIYHSPIGDLVLGDFSGRLCMCDWALEPRHERIVARIRRLLGTSIEDGDTGLLRETRKQLDEYFAGKRMEIDVPKKLCGTVFQQRVWNVLGEIPSGATISYSEVARQAGRPKAVRGAASAVAANALSVVVPCHRVVRSDGKPGGYAGGSEAKVWLLRMEASHVF